MKTKILVTAIILLIMVTCKPKTPEQTEQTAAAIQTTEYQKMITARVFIKPGKEADFISAAKMMIENSNKEEGCLGYMLYQDPYEKTNFIFVEKYVNQAAIDFHFGTSYFKEFGTLISDMTGNPMEIKIYDIAAEK
jgi:quinol monooxygenase YgiN